MIRFLVVGCGGSGGATVAYLMDQLRSDLAAHGRHTLPQGWQFVHIDVPNVSEPGPEGLGSVEEQGGTYFGCAPQAVAYSVLDDHVSRQIAGPAQLQEIATWAPREPKAVTNPISHGAGQYRAVGRMISLSRATAIKNTMQTVWNRLTAPETKSEMRGLDVPGLGPYSDGTPIVLVVSSMAGGAGASMALDVCRLLTLVHGLDPTLMGLFMVTPNIFDAFAESQRTGVRPNALAMMGEIIASQTGAARRHDAATLAALGVVGGGDEVPFARVFPVGRFAGIDRAQFGDGTPHAVYRGLGRGLAGLIMSERATTQFVSYDLGNTASPNGDRDLLGWGSEWSRLPWGSYGFASLSMGRDRYAEYAAQRLARSCVDRLLHGHLQRDSRESSHEQVVSLLGSQWNGVCRRAGMPLSEQDVRPWMIGYATPSETISDQVRQLLASSLERELPTPDGLQAARWVPALRRRLGDLAPTISERADDIAVQLAFDWHQQLRTAIEIEVSDSIAHLGLPYATEVVRWLGQQARNVVAPAAERLAAAPRGSVTAIPGPVESMLSGLRGNVQGGREIVANLVRGCQEQTEAHVEAKAAEFIARIMQQVVPDVLDPLEDALAAAQRRLEGAVDAPVTDRGLARLATDECAAWPTDDEERVQSRFDEADNEVLLTSSGHFHEQYESDLRRAPGAGRNLMLGDARTQVVREIILGEWVTTGGVQPPGGLLETRSAWRSRVFTQDPRTGQPIIPSHTGYDVHVRPAELRARAKMFVARPGESFDDFCTLSIVDFLRATDVPENGRDLVCVARRREFTEKFTVTLTLARPLISVNNTVLQTVHPQSQSGIEYRYKFSEVPVMGLDVEADLMRVVTTNPMIDQPTRQNLGAAVGDSAGVTRVDVFGSYPNYSPLVFDAVLGPASEQWAEVGDIGRPSFWQWRRSRPLDAALPMGDAEREAMVAGWLLGQIIGHIRTPTGQYATPVQVWDGTRWLAFPHPLLTPLDGLLASYDWLPAVLESVLLAMARSHEPPVMESLRPYQVLRGLYDDSHQGPARGVSSGVTSGLRNLTAWLVGTPTGGGSSAVPGADETIDVDERAKLATAWLTSVGELAGIHYMPPGEAPGGGAFSQVRDRHTASKTPLFRDLAPDVYRASGRLVVLVESARRQASAPPDPRDGRSESRPPASKPGPIIPELPDGGRL